MMSPHDLGRLLDELYPALVLYARQWCHAPEDVVQEAFIKLAALKPSPERVAAWLYRVVRNGAISAARSDQRRRQHETARAAQTETWFVPTEGTGLDATTATTALQTLPLDEREVLIAHLWGGLTFDEIGALIGTSSSTAHRRYLAALTLLRERLRVPCPNSTTPH
jgi:RNA polymerase sigma-70 factor (ECF subfamily)